MRFLLAAALLPFAATVAHAAESPLAGSGVTELLDLFTTLAGAAGLNFAAAVPEPTSMALLAAGAAGLAVVRRRRK